MLAGCLRTRTLSMDSPPMCWNAFACSRDMRRGSWHFHRAFTSSSNLLPRVRVSFRDRREPYDPHVV